MVEASPSCQGDSPGDTESFQLFSLMMYGVNATSSVGDGMFFFAACAFWFPSEQFHLLANFSACALGTCSGRAAAGIAR